MNPRPADDDKHNGTESHQNATVTTISRGHVVRWLGDAPCWNAVLPGMKAGVTIRAHREDEATRAAQRMYPTCEQVLQERERMKQAEARFQDHIRRAVDDWAREVPEQGVDWPGCLMVSVAYKIRGDRQMELCSDGDAHPTG